MPFDIGLFFTAEIWDVASTFAVVEIGICALMSLITATGVFFQALGVHPEGSQSGLISGSTMMTGVGAILTLLLAVIALLLVLCVVSWVGVALIFPEKLMATSPTVDPAKD